MFSGPPHGRPVHAETSLVPGLRRYGGSVLTEIFKEFTFEAAHRLPNVLLVTSARACMATRFAWRSTSRARGHHSGWVQDFADLTGAMKPCSTASTTLSERDREPQQPDQEVVAQWIWNG